MVRLAVSCGHSILYIIFFLTCTLDKIIIFLFSSTNKVDTLHQQPKSYLSTAEKKLYFTPTYKIILYLNKQTVALFNGANINFLR